MMNTRFTYSLMPAFLSRFHRCVQHRDLLQGVHSSFDEEAHEAELATVFFFETILHAFAHVHDRGHVDFVEGGEDGIGRL